MKTLFGYLGKLIKGLWKTITFLRVALLNVLFIILVVAIWFGISNATKTTPPEQSQPSALVLNLNGPIVEKASYLTPLDSFKGSALGDDMPKENVLFDIVHTIRHAKTDPAITGLVLSLGDMPSTSLTKLRYIAKAINEFKSSGKPVFATGDFYSQSQYYLASYADKVYLSPEGSVLLKGYSAYGLYMKDFLEKMNVNAHIFRVGTYKSAVEPFMRNNMSPAAREAATRWLGQLWGAYTDDVATNRHIDVKVLRPNMETFLKEFRQSKGSLADLSLRLGLVDKLTSRHQVRRLLANKFGSNGADSYQSISYYQYKDSLPTEQPKANSDIAVIVASGEIKDGKESNGVVGGDTLAAQLRDARNDPHVKAVVLRVDSPGGSAFASEVVREELTTLKAAGKPVVVSMSSLAASGGYWISMAADKIIAQPTTLTGSIGIFSVIPTFEKGLSKLGIATDGVGTTPFSGEGVTSGLSDGAKQAMQLAIDHGYQRFISLVGKYRNMSTKQVDEIAQGHVWTGQDAVKNGLVDQLGDFDDAVDAAAKMAKLKHYNLQWMEEPLTPAQQLLKGLMSEAHASLGLNISSLIPEALQPAAQQLSTSASLLSKFNDPKGEYAYCLPCQVK
ncbi:signal peptide peptidase SppA [Vibrio palustris]|uniref:Protease 4 n=1 Tax=Vibrio palustris TaxID=1918946 RepID=A0A1R4B1M7_9VIBR|nr:signal peptide peptidase SppA [Vibrio palustris]SJL82811.1 Protease 4 [Vibrio palustris]